jgi:hypothetical protein
MALESEEVQGDASRRDEKAVSTGAAGERAAL